MTNLSMDDIIINHGHPGHGSRQQRNSDRYHNQMFDRDPLEGSDGRDREIPRDMDGSASHQMMHPPLSGSGHGNNVNTQSGSLGSADSHDSTGSHDDDENHDHLIGGGHEHGRCHADHHGDINDHHGLSHHMQLSMDHRIGIGGGGGGDMFGDFAIDVNDEVGDEADEWADVDIYRDDSVVRENTNKNRLIEVSGPSDSNTTNQQHQLLLPHVSVKPGSNGVGRSSLKGRVSSSNSSSKRKKSLSRRKVSFDEASIYSFLCEDQDYWADDGGTWA